MDRCEALSKMRWTESISMRQHEQMSRERGFAESITAFVYFKVGFYLSSGDVEVVVPYICFTSLFLFSIHHKGNAQCDKLCQQNRCPDTDDIQY